MEEYKKISDNYFIDLLQPIIGVEKYTTPQGEQFIDTIKLYNQKMDTVEK